MPSYSYDANGNLLADGRRTFTYDDENQLNSIIVTNAGSACTLTTNIYDGLFRRRIRKEFSWVNGAWAPAGEVRSVYDGRLVVQERDGNNIPMVSYTRGSDFSGSRQGVGGIGGLLARTDHLRLAIGDSSANAFYHADAGGNITALINDKQIIAAKYVYDPFGNILLKSGPLADVNNYRFSSQEYHQNTGLLLYLYRAYDPNLQRWLNRDPIEEEGGLNLYAYVRNNPINRIDPLGLAWYDYIPCIGPGIRQAQGEAAIQAQLARYGYSSMQEFQLDHPGYGGTMTSGNLNAVQATANITSGAANTYLMAATAVTPTAAATRCALWTATRSRTAAENAFRHFGDHGADFAARNAVDYVTQARNFLHNPPAGTLTRIRPNGDVVRYNPASNTFGVMDDTGAPRTFFKPDPAVHGYPSNLDYFNAQ